MLLWLTTVWLWSRRVHALLTCGFGMLYPPRKLLATGRIPVDGLVNVHPKRIDPGNGLFGHPKSVGLVDPGLLSEPCTRDNREFTRG